MSVYGGILISFFLTIHITHTQQLREKNEKYPSEFVYKGEMICIYDIIRSCAPPQKQGQENNDNKFFFGKMTMRGMEHNTT